MSAWEESSTARVVPPARPRKLAKVPFVVSLSGHLDEATARAHLSIPDLTPLESWGDYSPREGVWGLMQPAMGPVPKIGHTNPDVLDLPQLAALRNALGGQAPASFPGVDTKAAGDLLLDAGRARRADDHLAAVLLAQAQALLERVGIGLVHLVARLLLADPRLAVVQTRLPLAGRHLLDADGNLHRLQASGFGRQARIQEVHVPADDSISVTRSFS